jgi:tetratricopeptide (TPR) repeat protein
MRLGRLVCGAVTVLSLTAANSSGSPAASVPDDPPTTAWTLAVWQHVPGKADGALATVAAIPHWRAANALRRREIVEDRQFLVRALVLHTDLAIVQRQAAEQRGTSPGERAGAGSFVVEDGTATGRREGSPHWAVAMQIAVILATWRHADAHPDAPPDADARRIALSWFHTVNALFLHWAEGSLRYVDTGLRHYPDDAGLHLYRGAVHQMFADGRVQQFLTGDADARGQSDAPQSAAVERARAESDLRRALELDPTLTEARIRLAHVVGDGGQPGEAVGLVQEALRAGVPPFFETYATLVLGRNLVRIGRLDEALAAFDRAATLAPAAQAPRIGRSQVALAAGRTADALRALTDARGPERAGPAAAEEWAIYFRVHDPTATVQLAALRAEIK